MDDVLSLKEVEENDAALLMDLFDYPLPYERAVFMAMTLSHDEDKHMFIMAGEKAVGIVEMRDDEVGYRIRKAYRGRGIATKAVAMFLAHCGKDTVEACCRKENAASRRVLLHNGFVMVKEEAGICYYVWHN